ncbi:MAG: TIGR01212 family radical SAM protein [Prevotella sp.]|nr:TIGR01212 family radical SAM protein [Prevotella sp.]
MHYNDFGTWARRRFPFRIQKISVDAGFSCPNRDGRIALGGCTFCDNRSFNPSYLSAETDDSHGALTPQRITSQLEAGKKFFARKYPDMKYLAYFQAFTNTYAPLDRLKPMYEEALSARDVVGIVIGTRPDCVSKELLLYLEQLSRQTTVIVEYGIESANDATLRRINRGHDFACSQRAVEETAALGIITGGHVIVGLPGESAEESLRQASLISSLPLNILKIHQLQIIKGTALATEYLNSPFHLYSVDEYIHLISSYIQLLRKDIVLDRFTSQSPSHMLIAPKWGMKNHEFADKLNNYLRQNNIFQGARHPDGAFKPQSAQGEK